MLALAGSLALVEAAADCVPELPTLLLASGPAPCRSTAWTPLATVTGEVGDFALGQSVAPTADPLLVGIPGTSQALALEAGGDFGASTYLVLGSTSGIAPGVVLPLVRDPHTELTARGAAPIRLVP